jgi:hypothetical protein
MARLCPVCLGHLERPRSHCFHSQPYVCAAHLSPAISIRSEQMLITGLSPKNVTGVLLVSASYASCSILNLDILVQRLRTTPLRSLFMFAFWKIQPAFCGIILSSTSCSQLTLLYSCIFQLRLEEGNGLCWFKKSRRNMLHELLTAIAVLHTLFPKSVLNSCLATDLR